MNEKISFAAILCSKILFSLPINPIVMDGEVQFQSTLTKLEIFAGEKTTIHWDDFSIGGNEQVDFRLPTSESLVLNRVVGNLPSEIFGQLNSNGRILLINPHGVIFGPHSRIESNTFLATTLDLQNEIGSKKWIFTGESKSAISNYGSINCAKAVSLIGHVVENQGILSGDSTHLIAAKEFGIESKGSENIHYCTISESTMIHTGEIFAKEAYLFGDRITIAGNSLIDVSGPFQGGSVWIGGSERGMNSSFEPAQEVYFGPNATILASSLKGGKGGEVVLWSTHLNQSYGKILAKDGGFVEISCKNTLIPNAFVDTAGGTLLLDPTDVTIGAGDTNITFPPPAPPPPPCGTFANPVTYTYAASPATIDVAHLALLLGCNDVIIDSNLGAGGVGNITWAAASDLLYTSAFSLTLRAPGTVTILSNVQNSGSGSLIIDSSGPSVNINTQTNMQAATFGSINGLTQIYAPNAVLTVQGSNSGINFWGQVGYHTLVGGLTASGPISIVCNTLTVAGSTQIRSYGFIGHGQMDTSANQTFSTTASATINVLVSGNIDLLSSNILPGSGTNAAAIIGHGQRSPAAGSVFLGDITVSSGGNITLLSRPNPGTQSVTARIGHGVNGTSAGNSCVINANVDVEATGNIAMSYFTGGGFQDLSIGHFVATGTPSGNVTVRSGGSIQLDGNPGAGNGFRLSIGHLSFNGSTAGNVRVFACQDVILNTRNSDVFGIGVATATNIPYVGDVEVAAGRNIQITSTGTSAVGRIGSSSFSAGTTTRTFVAAGGSIDIVGTRNTGIGAKGNVYVAAGGNINLTSNGSAATVFIGTDNTTAVPTLGLTRVFSGGNVIASNPVAGGRAVIGRGPLEAITFFTYLSSLDIRAAGDIQLSSPFTTNAGALIPTSGSVFIEADTELPSGAFWTAGGGQIASICQTVPNIPILVSPICPATTFSSDSFPISADGRGAFRINTGGNGGSVGLATTVGDITIHSAQYQASGAALQNLTIGTGLNNVNILTTSGNIEIWGTETSLTNCVRGDSFNNIIIDSALTTMGSIFISANNNINMTSVSSLNTFGMPITLIVDNQAPIPPFIGSGQFIMDSGSIINSGGGLLQIYTALQNANTINGTLNGVFPFVPGPIYQDTNQEVWCTYFCTPLPGFPFTISYKDCLQLIVQQAMLIAVQLPVDLHPYNEFPGWMARFLLIFKDIPSLATEPYYLRRRHLNLFNHPKTYTVYQL